MLIASHLKKIEGFESVVSRLEPLQDFELWFWSLMVSGTNAVNAALHHAGITPEESAFPTQPGVYLVASDGGWKPVLKEAGDVLHVGRPAIEGPVPQDIQRMMHAMERIETWRDPCTRGDTEPTPAIVAACLAAYQECVDLLHIRLGGH